MHYFLFFLLLWITSYWQHYLTDCWSKLSLDSGSGRFNAYSCASLSDEYGTELGWKNESRNWSAAYGLLKTEFHYWRLTEYASFTWSGATIWATGFFFFEMTYFICSLSFDQRYESVADLRSKNKQQQQRKMQAGRHALALTTY